MLNQVEEDDELAHRGGCACGCEKTDHEQYEDVDLDEFARLVFQQLLRELRIERERRVRA